MLLIWNEKNLFDIKLIDYTLKAWVYTCNFIYEPKNKFFTWKKQKPFAVYFKRFWDLKRYSTKNNINIDLITKKVVLIKKDKNKISKDLKVAYQTFKKEVTYREFKEKLGSAKTKRTNLVKIDNTTKKKDFKKDTNFNISKKALWL